MTSPKQLRQISIVTNQLAEDPVGVLLDREFGQTPSSYLDASTGLSTVSVYWQLEDDEVAGARAILKEGLEDLADEGIDVAPGRISIRAVKPRDWAESWKRHFKPISVGGCILVKPTWSPRKPKAGEHVVLIDPGLSFGTGQHATTHFCLTQVASLREPGRKQALLDIGTGSGILAIAASKLGYSPLDAFDFDPDCVRISAENAKLNGVDGLIKLSQKDLTKVPAKSSTKYEVICANLLADLLVAERDRILARLAPGGSVVLAGILTTQFDGVASAYEAAGLRLVESATMKEWRSGTFR
jgi:ribosomal protein L11 methyltransferase